MSEPLLQIAVFLGAAAVAPPLARWLKMGAVLGYLLAGIVIGPAVLAVVPSETKLLHDMAELGVAMFLFLIGLELRPKRLWAMRAAVFGLGSTQVLVTAVLIAMVGLLLGQRFPAALLIGLALSLSSTAFALQILEEKGELRARHGRLGFSILLFQDLAAIPIIALVPLFALGVQANDHMNPQDAMIGLAVIGGIVLVGRYVLNRLYRLIALTGVREAMTASALLTVFAVAVLMAMVGLSPSLGAFIAGILLADSEYRHQIESDIAPFEGLLLGLFFMTVGMSLNVGLIVNEPAVVAAGVVSLVVLKAVVLYALARRLGLTDGASRRLALVLSQGGEFAFVVLAAGVANAALDSTTADLLAVVVTLSMATTPLLLMLDEWQRGFGRSVLPLYDTLPKDEAKDGGHVVIAGFGRFGQIVARVLRAKRIPFTALDIDPETVTMVNQFGNKIYYGDATRLGLLESAQTARARAFVLAIDDVDASLKTAQVVRQHFPHVPLYARARNRQHVHRLRELGARMIERETFLSALGLTRELLHGLGVPESRARWIVETFKEHDERRLYESYHYADDQEKLRLMARKHFQELEELFAEDWQEPEEQAPPLTVAQN